MPVNLPCSNNPGARQGGTAVVVHRRGTNTN